MTNAMQSPDIPDRLIPNNPVLDSALPVEEEDMILQRGGEALWLEKSTDLMTIALNSDLATDAAVDRAKSVAEAFGIDVVRVMASVGLIELQVSPDRLEAVMQSVRQEKDVCFASHVYQLQKSPDTPIYLTNQITVQFAASVTAERMKTIAAMHGIEVFRLVPGVSKAFVFLVTTQAVVNPIKLANRLLCLPEILMAEPNIVVPIQWFTDPVNDSDNNFGDEVVSQDGQNQEQYQKSRQWPLHHNDRENLALESHISANVAWEITQGTRSTVVAIVDDAMDLSHPAFCGEGKIVAPADFGSKRQRENQVREFKTRELEGGANLAAEFPMPTPVLPMYGTFCAEFAVAEENSSGRLGVAPGCALMPIAISEFLDDQLIEQVCEWALDKGAAILNLGWGAKVSYFPLSLRQQAAITRVATQGRNGKGCVVVVAAGNANRPLNGVVMKGVVDEDQSQPELDQWDQSMQGQGSQGQGLEGETHWLNGLAVHPDVITVSAITSLNRKAAYSNWGTGISVCAPSNHAPNWGGTSVACAIVSGVAALVLAANPELRAREVKQLLQQTADKLIDSEPDPQLGLQHGTYNAKGYSQWFGYGKVNAFRAVQAAHEMAEQTNKRVETATRSIKKTNPQVVEIPDCDTQGITSVIEIEETGFLRNIEISVDVEHSFMSDLEIFLIPPKGMAILLQGRSSGRSTVLRKTYSLQTAPLLKTLLNQPIAGRWQLKLVDHVPLNIGWLTSWTLNLGL